MRCKSSAAWSFSRVSALRSCPSRLRAVRQDRRAVLGEGADKLNADRQSILRPPAPWDRRLPEFQGRWRSQTRRAGRRRGTDRHVELLEQCGLLRTKSHALGIGGDPVAMTRRCTPAHVLRRGCGHRGRLALQLPWRARRCPAGASPPGAACRGEQRRAGRRDVRCAGARLRRTPSARTHPVDGLANVG